jgi:hypothetical protein
MAGRQLGGALGGLLGAEDPELARIRQRQSLVQGLDLNSSEALRAAASRALQAGDTSAASMLASRAMQVEKSQAELEATQALTAQRMRERAAADPLQQLLRSGKYTPQSVALYAQTQQISDLLPFDKDKEDPIDKLIQTGKYTPASVALYKETGDIKALDTIEKADPTALSETAEGIYLVNKLTGEKIRRIGDAPKRGITVSPEIKLPPDIVGAVNAADKATEPERNMINSARLAKDLINTTSRTNNSQTWEAARTTIAKAVGENKLSNEDIRRTGVDPRLVEGALDWVNKKISGVPNADIQKQLFVLGSVLENNAQMRYDEKIGRFRRSAKSAGFPGDPTIYFPTANERTGGGAAPAVVDWSSLKK